MAPKPRMTIARPPGPARTTPSTTTTTSTPSPSVRRKRWVHAPATLVVLLMLHAFCHVFAFGLLTEPCLNPGYTSRMRDKLNYLTLLTTEGGIPVGEWRERFTRAGVRALFGVGVIQAWFVARLNAYVLKAHRQHSKLLRMLKAQRETGKTVGVDTRWQEEAGEEDEEVGSFVRQLESVSVTFLGLPLVAVVVYGLVVIAGAPAVGNGWKQTAVLAAHLSMLIALPLVHVLGIPDVSLTTTTTGAPANASASSSTTTTTAESSATTTLPNASTHWTSLLTLKPNPTFLLPLYYPLIGCFLGTLASTAVLALDWNVSYQTYPFPLLVGSLLGLVLGDVYTIGIVLFG
ncbi:conserved hypothetical protein [Sporisorium reilianum SRZ2]|uniref:Uncharacterized protein n=1 Tax=Sporisorium reilianum (strain SRZ2) TaxID=999809 RepID=E6ZUV8_SPORE|nr:conserved hypothetical protein [Sporisorium reilianum SRZ2]